MPKKFDYKVIRIDLGNESSMEVELNIQGQNGWECISIIPFAAAPAGESALAFLKREAEE